MKKGLMIFMMCFVFLGIGRAGRGEEQNLSIEDTYKQIQLYVQNKDWGALYDSYDTESMGLMDTLINYPLFLWFQFGDGGPSAGYVQLPGRSKYIEILGRNGTDLQRLAGSPAAIIIPGYIINSGYTIANVDKNGNDAEVAIKGDGGVVQKIYMRVENGKWKMHINEDSTQYKVARAVESRDYDKVAELLNPGHVKAEDIVGQIRGDWENKLAGKGKNNKDDRLFEAIDFFCNSRNLGFGFNERMTLEKVEQAISSLLSEGANINAKKDEFGHIYPLFFYAVDRSKNREIAQFLISKGVNVNAADSDGKTALHLAAGRGDNGIAELLIEKGADVNAKDKYGRTVLMDMATSYTDDIPKDDYKKIISLIISKGAHIDDVDQKGDTALLWAAEYNNKELVELLLLKGADINIIGSQRMTALGLMETPSNQPKTVLEKRKEIIELLRSRQN